MTSLPEKAVGFWNSGYYCAESVLLAAAQAQGVNSEIVPRIATGFCSGVAQTGGMCGAVSGAVMALSLADGRDGENYDRSQLYQKIQSLVVEFEAKFGSRDCSQLLGLALGTAEGQAEYQARNLAPQCEAYVREAALLVERLLDSSES